MSSFDIGAGKCLGLVGKSGSGKSVTALAIMGLLPPAPACAVTGDVVFEGQRLQDLEPEAMRRLRGSSISMVFQEPMTALNPVFKIGDQIAGGRGGCTGAAKASEARERAIKMLETASGSRTASSG